MKYETDPIRAQFLMSPYNVKEAKRAREFRRILWCAAVAFTLGVVVFGAIIYLH